MKTALYENCSTLSYCFDQMSVLVISTLSSSKILSNSLVNLSFLFDNLSFFSKDNDITNLMHSLCVKV